ncbi:MAG: AI-2E family transporter [Rhodospirillales bacterium]|nr:AI-2E family transporter [Rhodospirillales bacterium]
MSTRTQALFWLLLVAFFFLALWTLADILLPFVAGLAIAYLFDPLVDRLQEHKIPRGIASFVVLVLFFLVAVLVLLLLLPLLQAQISELARTVPRFVEMAQRILDHLIAVAEEYTTPEVLQRAREAVGARIGDVVGWFARLLQTVLTSSVAFFNVLSLVFITPVVAFFLLRDWDRMLARIDSWLPRRHAPVIRAQAAKVDETLSGFVRGQGTVCLLLGAFYAIALALAGLDFGLVIGVFIGLISFVPFAGTMIGAMLSIGLAALQFGDWMHVLVIAGIFVFGQAVEGNVLTPKLVGDRVNLHPVWVIFALLAFGSLFGFVGVLLAVPIAAILGVLVRFALERYLASPLYDPKDGATRP